jgi:ubiquinone/menaquinone biosynthesis C-methylase UbiE
VLDLGVGGGRTAGPLSKIASCYVGLDYSQGMVAICRARDPRLELHHGDATDLSRFENRHFDAVVFLATGVDYIRTDEDRVKCLREVARVSKPGGVFVVSSHNAQAIGAWPRAASKIRGASFISFARVRDWPHARYHMPRSGRARAICSTQSSAA